MLFTIELAALSALVIVAVAIDYIHKVTSGHFDNDIVSKEINLGRPNMLTISSLNVHVEYFSFLLPQYFVAHLILTIRFRFISNFI